MKPRGQPLKAAHGLTTTAEVFMWLVRTAGVQRVGADTKRGLRPFWFYYGGKANVAHKYPTPAYRTIVEPFAGAAGYSLRYYDRDVVLVERNPVIAGMWRYLIAVTPSELRRIPLVENIDDLPSWVPPEARSLVGFKLTTGAASPQRKLTGMQARAAGNYSGWTEASRERAALQVPAIRHWNIIEGDYTLAPDVEATWFVDPPYNNQAGRAYKFGSNKIDFAALGAWCRTRQGHVIVCENAGATWLPFVPLFTLNKPHNGKPPSVEVMWTARNPTTNPPRASTGL